MPFVFPFIVKSSFLLLHLTSTMAPPSAAPRYSQPPHFKKASKTSVKQQQQQHTSKSCTNIFLKSLIVMLVLVIIPLFPSQAPNFITQSSIITQFWELFHLMFIGIVVCYGLFCKRSSNKASSFDTSDVYASNVASIFDNGLENFCGVDEKKVIPDLDSQSLQHYECKGQERFDLDERRVIPNWGSQFLHYEQERTNLDEKSRSFLGVDGAENTVELNERKVGQVWNSQYFVGESMVVVANGNYGVEKLDRVYHEPLGLPVRSLRYRAGSAEIPESIHENTAKSGGSIGYEVRGEKIRGMVPINLGRKFEEASGPCQVSWRSRSQRRDLGGENTVKPPSHSRPHSVGQLEFGHVKSRSFRKPVSSRTSPTSSPSITSPSSSYPSENGSSKMIHSGPQYDLDGISISTSPQTGASAGEAAVLTSKVKLSNNTSCSEMNMLRDDYEEDKKMKMNPSSNKPCHIQGNPHSKTPSAGETEFGHLEPWSFWNQKYSQIFSNSSSPRAISPVASTSPEMPNFSKQDLERLKDVKPPSFQGSQPAARPVNDTAAFVASKTKLSPVGSSSESDTHCTSKDKLKNVAPVNGEAKFHNSKSRAFSIGSSSEITTQECLKHKLKHANKDLKEDSFHTQKQSVDFLVSDVKPPVRMKVLSRGKSVRTFRSRRSYIDRLKRKEACPKESGDINEASCDQFDTVLSMKRINGEGCANPLGNSTKVILDNTGSIPSSAFSENEPKEKQHFVNTNIVESKGNSESVLTNSHMSSDEEEVGSNLIDDADLGSEVDRKAGEFIAKFREQIRLQKIESFRRASG